jgi:hypothetical protein
MLRHRRLRARRYRELERCLAASTERASVLAYERDQARALAERLATDLRVSPVPAAAARVPHHLVASAASA